MGAFKAPITADQDTSFQAMDKTMLPMINIVAADPAIDTVNGFKVRALLFISLKPLEEQDLRRI